MVVLPIVRPLTRVRLRVERLNRLRVKRRLRPMGLRVRRVRFDLRELNLRGI